MGLGMAGKQVKAAGNWPQYTSQCLLRMAVCSQLSCTSVVVCVPAGHWLPVVRAVHRHWRDGGWRAVRSVRGDWQGDVHCLLLHRQAAGHGA